MKKTIIDTCGQLCPKPIIMTKKALQEPETTEIFDIILDNEIAKNNVERFLQDHQIEFTTRKENNLLVIEAKKAETTKTFSNPKNFCQISPQTQDKISQSEEYILAITSDKMGTGADELGAILMKAFINTLKEVETLPQKIVFYNSGVKLTTEDADTLPALKELEAKGIKIIVCGTCSNFYDLTEKVKVGVISNMYDIASTLTSAPKIVQP